MSMCRSKGPCCAQGNSARSMKQTMHSTVGVSTAFPITRNKDPGPTPAHTSPWSAKPSHQGGFFWFSKVLSLLPPPSCALEDPWAWNSLPLGLPCCPSHHEAPASTISDTLSQTHKQGCVPKHSGGTNWSQCPHYPYYDLFPFID